MDIRRVILGAALAMLTYALWTAWQVDYPKSEHKPINQTSIDTDSQHALLPTLRGPEHATQGVMQTEVERKKDATRLIHVKTDVLDLDIDLNEGDIVGAKLLDYPESLDDKTEAFNLLSNKPGALYVANSSLLKLTSGQVQPVYAGFNATHQTYQLGPHDDQLIVTLKGETEAGLNVEKSFVFKRGGYLIDVQYTLKNQGDASWKGYLNTQILRDQPKEDKSAGFQVGSYTGASYSNPGHHRYKKLTFKDMHKNALDVEVDGGWFAMQQRYFLTAWIPAEEQKSRFYSRTKRDSYAIGAVGHAIQVAPGARASVGSKLYLGPEVADYLKAAAPGLDLTIDYGWLWFISSFLFSIMKFIYSVVGNWGWAIVLLTVLIKLVFYRFSSTSYRSMANMRQLQPKLQALREKYGDDKAKISQETMALYRKEKVNPLSGCLPMLVQLPIFFALYWVLIESIELRQAPFALWIHDLASADPFHVLPLLMGLAMFMNQKLNPMAVSDSMQAKLILLSPVFMVILFWNFPAGLVLYSVVNTLCTGLQQWYITRQHEAKK